MKKLLPVIFACLCLQLSAQTYHPMLSGDSVLWKYHGYAFLGSFTDFEKTIKDTTIGSYTYKKIATNPGTQYFSCLREDSVARKVYSIVMGTDQLLYDFSLNLNDSAYIRWQDGSFGASPINGYYVVDSIATMQTLAGPRKFMRLHYGANITMRWLEGVGILDNYLNYPITYCDVPDCSAFYTLYCQTRNTVNTFERSPLYSCDSGLIRDCTAHINYTHNDSDFVFSANINGVGPYDYRWQCYRVDSPNIYVLIDSSFYPNAHFVLDSGKHYAINVYYYDTSGCSTGAGINLYDTLTNAAGNCSAYFWVYPDVTPGAYIAQDLSTGSNLSYLWDFGDGNTSTQQYPSHQYSTPNRYTICLTVNNNNGCTATYCDSTFYDYKTGGGPMESLNVVTTSVREATGDMGIMVYPNPATGRLYISAANSLALTNPLVYDVTGKLIPFSAQKTTQGYVINTAALTPGMYCVMLNAGNTKVVRRFIKQ